MMTSACMFFTFLYQITFFAALMVVSAKTQLARRNACVPCLKASDYCEVDNDSTQKFAAPQRRTTKDKRDRQKNVICAFDGGKISPITSASNTSFVSSTSSTSSTSDFQLRSKGLMGQFFRKFYIDFILDWRTKIFMLFVFLAYIGLAIWGILTMEQGLDYEKLLLKTDPLVRTVKVEIELFHGGDQIEIAVAKAPDMTKLGHRKLIEQIAQEFESIPYSIGPKGTQLWIREYQKYANQTGSFLHDDHDSWVRGVYDWSQLFAYYKLWLVSTTLTI